MKLSYRWLKDIVNIPWSPEETAEKLTELGFPVDKISPTGMKVDHVVSARILTVDKHPNADRLSLAKVFDGKEEKDIVCGANNIAPGQIVPLALPGAEFPGGLQIAVSKIRGVQSNGMMCSSRELGISEDHAGIYQFPEDTPLGKEVKKILGEGDTIFEVDITPNRPDTLCHIGIARELSALSGEKCVTNKFCWKTPPKGEPCKIKIQEPDLCSRYLGKLIHGVKVAPSPEWMVQRLTDCGIRPINNIVDITNTVLLEYGHPLHAFDLQKLANKEVNVRRARDGEKMLALDENTYELKSNDLIISDQEKPVAIAGVMGGEATGVSDTTTDIFLESAVFDRVTVRNTSRRLSLKSESSIRFEKGTDVETANKASLRAAQLILELAGGKMGKRSDAFPRKPKSQKITLRAKRLNAIIGQDIKPSQTKVILDRLECNPVKKGPDWTCTIPSHRKDLLEEIDLIEEVVRVVGYNTIESAMPQIRIGNVPANQIYRDHPLISDYFKGMGFHETITNSFANDSYLTKFNLTEDKFVPMANAISKEESVLRPLLLPQLIKAVQRNINFQRESVPLFEIGNRFQVRADSDVPEETQALSFVAYGTWKEKTWNHSGKVVDFFTLKGIFESLSEQFQLGLKLKFNSPQPFLHPHQSFTIHCQGKPIGWGGMLHPGFSQEHDLKSDCAVAEFDLEKIKPTKTKYKGFSSFPFVERDIALIVPKDQEWGKMRSVVEQSGGSFLKSVVPFDIFSGKDMDPAKKSMAFRVRLQSMDATLSDAQINEAVDKIKTELKSRCDAELR